MNAKELRIGNYINSTKSTCNYSKGIFQVDFYTFEKIHYNNGLQFIEPIPLTEDWLLKFKQYTKWNYFGDIAWGGYIPFVGKKKIMIRYWKDEITTTVCTVNTKSNYYRSEYVIKIPLKYVHQLQNLYFALTGEELTTK